MHFQCFWKYATQKDDRETIFPHYSIATVDWSRHHEHSFKWSATWGKFSTLWRVACVDKLEEKIHLWRSFCFRKFIFASFQADLFSPWGGAFAPSAPPPCLRAWILIYALFQSYESNICKNTDVKICQTATKILTSNWTSWDTKNQILSQNFGKFQVALMIHQ